MNLQIKILKGVIMCYEGKSHNECKYECSLFVLYDGCDKLKEAKSYYVDDEDRYL